WDLRVFVLGCRVLGAMQRRSDRGWRTNVAQGGRSEGIHLAADHERLALQAADALAESTAGVDLLPRPAGQWYVLEVNAVPGWRALAPVTGVDVAREIVQFLSRHGHK